MFLHETHSHQISLWRESAYVLRELERRKAMRRKFHSWIVKISVVVALLVSSFMLAQEVSVSTNSMPGTNFSKFHTYKWVTILGSDPQPNQIVNAEIKQAIDSQLAARGLTKTDSDQADLFVAYQVAIDHQKDWTTYNDWNNYPTQITSTIGVGTLVLDMYDPAAKQLVWTGSATKTLDPSASQEKKQKHLDQAMEKLLKDFPPKKQ
jgi:hypothetical protein